MWNIVMENPVELKSPYNKTIEEGELASTLAARRVHHSNREMRNC